MKWGENLPVCGRRLCTSRYHLGPRWLALHCFWGHSRSRGGRPTRWSSDCRTCRRLYERERLRSPAVRKRRSETTRESKRITRRLEGVLPRWPEREAQRYATTYDAYRGSKGDVLPAEPLLAWLEGWRAYQARGAPEGRTGSHTARGGILPAGMGDLCRLAGVSERAFVRARSSGRVSVAVADRVLVAGGSSILEVYGVCPVNKR